MSNTTLLELLKEIQQAISITSESPRLDAEVLITHALEAPRTIVYTDQQRLITDSELALLQQLIQRRLQGEPLAYIIGEKEFWSLSFTVTPNTLIPRPETEHLIEWTLNQFSNNQALTVADLGTGSGAIAITLAHECPAWHIDATDKSFAALEVAARNAQQNNVHNIALYQGDWFGALPEKQYDLIVSNPPYIAEQDTHLDALGFEPTSALVAGLEGLDDLQKIIVNAPDYLYQNGWLAVEHGYDQANRVQALFDQAGFDYIQTHHDLAGIARFSVGQKIRS